MRHPFSSLFWHIAIAALITCLGQAVHAQMITLRPSGKAIDVGIGPEGTIWIIDNNDAIKRWTGSGWASVPGGALRVAVTPDGRPWAVNRGKQIYENLPGSNSWILQPGGASDIAVSYKNEVWITSDNGTYLWNPSLDSKTQGSWVNYQGEAIRITVDPLGNPWVVNRGGQIYRLNKAQDNWTIMPGSAKDISVGRRGDVWIVDGNGDLAQWNGNDWVKSSIGTGAKYESISAGPTNVCAVTTTKDLAFFDVPKPVIAPELVTGQVEFINKGSRSVVIYRCDPNNKAIKTQVGTITQGGSKEPFKVKIGDRYEAWINNKEDTHIPIYITDLNDPVFIYGNIRISDNTTMTTNYKSIDYEVNRCGVDILKYNPMNLSKGFNSTEFAIFKELNDRDDTDYSAVGNKIFKRGFNYSSGINTSFGSNDVTMTYGYNSFAKSWSLNVSGKGVIKGVDVAGSFGYSEEEFSERSNESIYAVAKKGFHSHSFSVDPIEALLDDKFKSAVLNVIDLARANEFIRQYGTHYPTSILYGGQYSAYLKMGRNEYSTAKRFGIDVGAEVGKSTVRKVKSKDVAGKKTTQSEGHDYGAKVNFGYSQGSTEHSIFSKTQSKYYMVGGAGGMDDWSIDETNAAPVDSDLDFIYTLIDPRIFKDDTDPYRLFKVRGLVRQASETYLSGKVLGKPLPPPQVYTVILSKIQVTEEVDDLNKQTKGSLSGFVYKDAGYSQEDMKHDLWREDSYSDALQFRKGNTIHPHIRQFSFVVYPNPDGSFGRRYVKVTNSIREKDDLWEAWNNDWKSSEFSGEGRIDIGAMNLQPGENKTHEFPISYFVTHANKGEMKVTLTIRRDMPEFWEGAGQF